MTLSESKKLDIIVRKSKGESNRNIAKDLNCSPQTVSNIYKNYMNRKLIKQATRKYKKKLITDREKRNILRNLKKGTFGSMKDASSDLNASVRTASNQISYTSIRRRFNEDEIFARVKVKKPYLSKQHKRQRYLWALKYRDWNASDWDKVLWSDETKISLHSNSGRKYTWRRKDEAMHESNLRPTFKHGGGNIFMWGCMSSGGVGYACKINDGLDSELYLKIMDDEMTMSYLYLFPNNQFIFQHDNDPKHKSKIVTKWLLENHIKVLDWPSQSPDLNPIEHLWHELKKKIYRFKAYSLEERWSIVEREWWKMDKEFCRKLVHSMPKRIQAVIDAKGGSTKY